MESNNRHKTEDNFRRDSFSDRFCDDLCEDILQYLRLEDKLRLECVSKQFQRTIFVKEIVLDYDYMIGFRNRLLQLETVLQKFVNISHIMNKKFYLACAMYLHNLLDLIIKCCDKITHFEEMSNTCINGTYQVKLLDKFGPQLISFKVNKTFVYNWQSLTNIEELSTKYSSNLSAVKFNRLKRLHLKISNKDLDSLEAFLQLNGNTITHLDINSRYEDTVEEEENKTKRLMNITKNLKNLLHFGVIRIFGVKRETFFQYMRQLSLSSPQIKSLKLNYCFDPKSNIPEEELLSPLRQLKHLRRLSIILRENGFNGSEENQISFKIFKGLQQLTHLTAHCPSYGLSKNILLTDIDINLPSLQYLKLNSFDMCVRSADILCRLSRLETLISFFEELPEIPEFRAKLIANCKRFKLLKTFFY